MSQSGLHRLGDLQLRILKVLWERREASVADVHHVVAHPGPLAYTTIATMLRKMEARDLVKHRTVGRSFIYRAIVEADHVSRGMAEHVLDGVFEGSVSAMVSHLLTAHEVSQDELVRLEELIAQRRSES